MFGRMKEWREVAMRAVLTHSSLPSVLPLRVFSGSNYSVLTLRHHTGNAFANLGGSWD